jgi:hypothetical protein
MKKNLIFPTVTLFVIAILFAGGCKSAVPGPYDNPKKVIIYLKAVRIDGKKHLEMSDSNNPDSTVIDSLATIVNPGDTVVWEITSFRRIKKIEKIGRKTPGQIINKDAEQIPDTKKYKLVVPADAPYDTKEKYDIKFKGWVSKSTTIDPYLRIPKEVD